MSSPQASSPHGDSRVVRGMAAQLAERRRRLASGERSVGWKVGFGSAAAMRDLGIDAPLTGFLTDRSLLEPDVTVPIAGWARPVVEPEIAVHLAGDVPPGGDAGELEEAMGGVGPAFELADVDPPPDDVEAILAGNVFQRAVMVGAPAGYPPKGGLAATIAGPGGNERVVADPQAATGLLLDVVRHVANRLGAFGETLRAGELVICGSIVPPIPVQGGDAYRYRLGGLGELSIRFRA